MLKHKLVGLFAVSFAVIVTVSSAWAEECSVIFEPGAGGYNYPLSGESHLKITYGNVRGQGNCEKKIRERKLSCSKIVERYARDYAVANLDKNKNAPIIIKKYYGNHKLESQPATFCRVWQQLCRQEGVTGPFEFCPTGYVDAAKDAYDNCFSDKFQHIKRAVCRGNKQCESVMRARVANSCKKIIIEGE